MKSEMIVTMKSIKRFFLFLTILGGICLSPLNSVLLASSPPSSISVELIVGKKVVNAWVVLAQGKLEQGLSGVEWLGHNEGMIFILPKKGKTKFHMKGIKIPLSIAYVNWRGRILKIEDMDFEMPDQVYEAPNKTRFALEMNQGWFKRCGIKEGDLIRRKA